ncbi:MAG: ergothioneine biosynthesis protein EgtB [Pseudomonadota bacterium]
MYGLNELSSSDLEAYRAALRRDFERVRARTEALVAPLSAEDCQIQSMPDASPTKWHLAHTTWFWETFLLKPMRAGYETPDPVYDFMFNSYYEAVGPRHARSRRGMVTRPSLEGVLSYRAFVTDAMGRFLDETEEAAFAKAARLIETGLAHEEQHQELILTDIKHALYQNPAKPAAYPRPPTAGGAPASGWTTFEGGLNEFGAPATGFSFDNEHPRHKVWLEGFALANHPVTNGDVRAFIDDGGYRTPALWLSAGWAQVQAEGWDAPLYWEKRDGAWFEHTLHGEQPLDNTAPAAHLSYFEADAIAEWMGPRLPTEAELELAAAAAPEGRSHVAGACAHPAAASDAPLGGFYGEVWQWTTSSYGPYPGYRRPKGAIGEYNGKFMSGQYVLKGSSCATPPGHARATYRNFFYPGDRWQFTGLRLAKDV